MSIVSPKYAIQSSIGNYFTAMQSTSGSLLSGSQYTCYTGIGNVDLASAPAIIIDGGQTREIVAFSRCYEFSTTILVKEMAADTNALGILSQLIYNECVDSATAAKNFSNPAYNINVWSVITDYMEPSSDGDTIVNAITLRIIGALTP